MKISRQTIQAGITGFESPANEYIDVALSLDELLIQRNSATFIGQARGHSMTGFGIFNGDLLIVDRAAPRSNFDIVVATLNGEFICKSIDRENRMLISACPERKIYLLMPDDDYQEEGIVISSVRLHRKLSRGR
ncbi:protein impA [Glaciecola punicea ACAM 611]|jgi:DNA polymerase V|uniref:Protein impA n=1 Tax=Glaciecola punicea ACAM 611 TaxID=1121923 RepID=H5TES0_9ALTE|nr:S24 family peptidase [Glaciecola punicea]OFA32656.1 DNA polymerase V [Glaciecola punicea]GAB56847.1 protein impA [Glaciecola punicea ACAM 611]